jgi:glycosyltransferase involved in cell wall biosynthesis
LYDLANGVRYVAKLSRKQKFDILHVRGHIPAPIGAVIKRMFGGKLLFDIRGFLPEEYLDAGVWTETGAVYRSFKRVERQLMKEADGFIVLTEAARQILFPESAETGFDRFGRPVEVIPCCLDFRRMVDDPLSRDKFREANGWTDRFVVTHVGSLGDYI